MIGIAVAAARPAADRPVERTVPCSTASGESPYPIDVHPDPQASGRPRCCREGPLGGPHDPLRRGPATALTGIGSENGAVSCRPRSHHTRCHTSTVTAYARSSAMITTSCHRMEQRSPCTCIRTAHVTGRPLRRHLETPPRAITDKARCACSRTRLPGTLCDKVMTERLSGSERAASPSTDRRRRAGKQARHRGRREPRSA